MELEVVNNWVKTAEGCFARGDMKQMRACGREILENTPKSPEGLAIMAEASVYLQDFEAAEKYLTEMYQLPSEKKAAKANLRGLYASALFFGAQYELTRAMSAYEQLFKRYQAGIKQSLSASRLFVAGQKQWTDCDKQLIKRAYSFYADTCLLAGETEKAAQAAFMLSGMLEDPAASAKYFSNGLFLSNYRSADKQALALKHAQYGQMFPVELGFPHDCAAKAKPHALRIGYISPDFRLHAAAYFFTALLKDANHTEFAVYVYSTGSEDHVTQRFRKMPVHWRNVHGQTPQAIAKAIHDDRIDILVDLSGHSQNSCLPVMACRPAPVQVSGIGYINTTGLPAVDYFLTDEICMPEHEHGTGFTERPMRVEGCHLCYRPETMRELKSQGHDAPALKNGYVTFGSFNSFAKVTDEMLVQWRNILQGVPNAKLIIKCKICSVPSGQEIVRERFRRVGGDLRRLELRPFSQGYLEEYNDIDIVLDTAPYNGGLTTCDALYMGVPVVTLAGHTHGSRYGATILTAAGLPELVASNVREYVSKAVALANNGILLNKLHRDLPDMMRDSTLMSGKIYMQHLEDAYHRIWKEYLG